MNTSETPTLCLRDVSAVWSDVMFFLLFLFHRQMSEPHTGLTLKCAKCGVVSTTALSATTASNAM